MPASFKTRPGAISLSLAISSRLFQICLTMADSIPPRTSCIPEVRRHGSCLKPGDCQLQREANS